MARPKKIRLVEFVPPVQVFKPMGVPRAELKEIVLTLEEMEAVRLKNVLGLEQEECAARMSISRPTFQRILNEAYGKLAQMLTEGLALRVEGGAYKLIERQPCPVCQEEMILPLEPDEGGAGEDVCPSCHNVNVRPGRGRGRRRGHRGGRH